MSETPRSLLVDGCELALDEAGYLRDRERWSEAVATALAAADGVELGAAHWELIRFLRGHYARYRHLPSVTLLARAAARELGSEKGQISYFYELFPRGPGRQLFRYAGLPKPSGCR